VRSTPRDFNIQETFSGPKKYSLYRFPIENISWAQVTFHSNGVGIARAGESTCAGFITLLQPNATAPVRRALELANGAATVEVGDPWAVTSSSRTPVYFLHILTNEMYRAVHAWMTLRPVAKVGSTLYLLGARVAVGDAAEELAGLAAVIGFSPESEKDAKLAQKLGQLQPFT
jgi:hypothetical protein